MMRFLRLSSCLCLILLAGCSSPYKHLLPAKDDGQSVLQFKPTGWLGGNNYRCHVNGRFLFKSYHLSGLLYFRNLNDTTHVIFQNEMGFTFFHFSWDAKDHFFVGSIIPQLNKPAIVKTLRKDFELLLVRNIPADKQVLFTKGDSTYYRVPLTKGYAYYIGEKYYHDSKQLMGIAVVTRRQHPVTTFNITVPEPAGALPSNFIIRHHKAHLTIDIAMIWPPQPL